MKKTNYNPKSPKTKYLLNAGGKKFKSNTLSGLIWKFITRKAD
jgi:hypothetical protein